LSSFVFKDYVEDIGYADGSPDFNPLTFQDKKHSSFHRKGKTPKLNGVGRSNKITSHSSSNLSYLSCSPPFHQSSNFTSSSPSSASSSSSSSSSQYYTPHNRRSIQTTPNLDDVYFLFFLSLLCFFFF
jgi:hypothetical protein